MWLVGNPYNKAPQLIPFWDCSHELAQILLQIKADSQHPYCWCHCQHPYHQPLPETAYLVERQKLL